MARELHFEDSRGPRSAGRGVDDAIAMWATTHFGVVTRAKLLALGLSARQIRWRCAAGRLRPTRYEGVYLVGHAASVEGQREAIVVAASGRGTVLAGRSSGSWSGQSGAWHGAVELIVPMGRHKPLPGAVRRVADLPPSDVTSHRGLPCTTPQRTAMDLPPEQLRQALQWLVKRDIAIEPLVERMRGRRGARAFRAEVAQLVPQMAHTMSELEDRFLRLCTRGTIDLPLVNASSRSGDILDCSWPGSRLVVELDGRRWHEHRDREDRARDRRRVLEGLLPFRYAWADVVFDEPRTAHEVIRALALG